MKVKIGGFETIPETWGNIRKVLAPSVGEPRITHGPLCDELEHKFADLHGCQFGIVANSGTSALHAALQAMKELYGWQDGDEVLVPALTFPATVNVVIHNNLTPVFVDVDSESYTMNPNLASEEVTDRTRAMIPVHTFGQPADMTALTQLALWHDLKVIEDACETAVVKHGKTPVGAWGDAACFSFYISHILTGGVGGITATSDQRLATKIKSLCNHGWDRKERPVDVTDFDMAEVSSRYHFTSVGHSFRMTEFAAALILPQLEQIGGDNCPIKARQRYAAELTERFGQELPPVFRLPRIAAQNEHAFMMYPLVIADNAPFEKVALIEHLERSGIETRDMLPLINQPCYEGLIDEDDYPVAKWINERGFYIGCHPMLTDRHLRYTVDKFKEFCNVS